MRESFIFIVREKEMTDYGMKTLKIILQIIFLCFLGAGVAHAAVPIPYDYYLTAEDAGMVEERYRPHGMYKPVKVKVSENNPAYGKFTYFAWYPDKLEQSGQEWPLVILMNGTGVTCDTDEPLYEHLASWGFIVLGNTDTQTRAGYSAQWGLEIMENLARDKQSVFYKKIDFKNMGIGGHSQGANGAVSALLKRDMMGRFKTVVTISGVTTSLMEKLDMEKWDFNPGEIAIPWFMVAGDGPIDRKLITPLSDMESLFEGAKTFVVMGRRGFTTHSDIQAESDAYVTAWFRWQLKDDRYAARAFTGKEPEILANSGWNHVHIKNR